MMMDPMGWGVGMMIAMTVLGLVVLGSIVAAVVFVTRSLTRRNGEPTPVPRAITILEERFARGEIDRNEYESRRRSLSHS